MPALLDQILISKSYRQHWLSLDSSASLNRASAKTQWGTEDVEALKTGLMQDDACVNPFSQKRETQGFLSRIKGRNSNKQ